MAFVHEYDSTEYETYEECREALEEFLEVEDIRDEMDLGLTEILSRFFRRKSNEEFINWFQEEIDKAHEQCIDHFITEYEEGEIKDDE